MWVLSLCFPTSDFRDPPVNLNPTAAEESELPPQWPTRRPTSRRIDREMAQPPRIQHLTFHCAIFFTIEIFLCVFMRKITLIATNFISDTVFRFEYRKGLKGKANGRDHNVITNRQLRLRDPSLECALWSLALIQSQPQPTEIEITDRR